MDLCFNESLVDLTKLGVLDGASVDMAVFPDVLNVGSIADMRPEARLGELRRFCINPSGEFVGQCQVVDAVAWADRLTIWIDCPYRLVPEVLYIAGLVREDAKVTVREILPEGGLISEIALDQRACAEKWRELVAENAPLRVVENGQVVSVGEGYFDKMLLDAWEDSRGSSTKEAVGKVFDAYVAASGVSFPDDFLTHRLGELLTDRSA